MDPDKIQIKLNTNSGEYQFTESKGDFLNSDYDYSRQVGSNVRPCDVINYLMKKKGAFISELGDKVKGINAIPYRVCLSKCGKKNEVVIGIKIIPFTASAIDPAEKHLIRPLFPFFNRLLNVSSNGKIDTHELKGKEDELKEAEKLIIKNPGAAANIEARLLNAISLLNEGKEKRNTPCVMRSFMDFNCGLYKVVNKKSLDNMLLLNAEHPEHGYLPVAKIVMTEWASLKTLDDFLTNLIDFVDNSSWYKRSHTILLEDGISMCIRVIIFQIMYTLAVVRKHIPGFIHNDLHFSNILVSKGPKSGFTEYVLNNEKYFVPNLGFDIKLWDFDLSSTSDIVNFKITGNQRNEDAVTSIRDPRTNWRASTAIDYRELLTISLDDRIHTHKATKLNRDLIIENIRKYYPLARDNYPDIGTIPLNNLIKPTFTTEMLYGILTVLENVTYSYSDAKICSRRTGWRNSGDGFGDVQKILIILDKYANMDVNLYKLLRENVVSDILITKNGSYTGKKQPGMYTAEEFIKNAKLNKSPYFELFNKSRVRDVKLPFKKTVVREFKDSTLQSLEKVRKSLAIKNTQYGEGASIGTVKTSLQETIDTLRTAPVVNTSKCSIM